MAKGSSGTSRSGNSAGTKGRNLRSSRTSISRLRTSSARQTGINVSRRRVDRITGGL